ncbi:MAG: acyltransferase family protein, partial [Tannerellaceae bacterium]|nr:acyltransferase family protein [Tannerellaceae bacterium]
EYAGNVMYALFFRRLATKALAIAVCVAAALTLSVTLLHGSVSGGWVLSWEHLGKGFVRLLYPFLVGLLLHRISLRPSRRSGSFLWCSILLVAVLIVPSPAGFSQTWLHGLYESIVILLIFPAIVYMGSGFGQQGRWLSGICKFLGEISYPIYLVNYPIIYIFTGWISRTNYNLSESWWMAVAVFVATILTSYLLMRWVEGPLRGWLGRKLMR